MFKKKGSYRVNNRPKSGWRIGAGGTLGEGVLDGLPRDSTALTASPVELLRVDKDDLKALAEKNKDIMGDLKSNCKMKNGINLESPNMSPKMTQGQGHKIHPAMPITEGTSMPIARAAWVLRTLLLKEPSNILRDRRTAGGRLTVSSSASGSELVTWLVSLHPSLDRNQATMMWQALLEEGAIYHVTGEEAFKDKSVLYQFRQDREGIGRVEPTQRDLQEAASSLEESLAELQNRAPDAWLRMILRKSPIERTPEDLEIIYEELMSMKALSHLSNSIKRELAGVIMFEAYPKQGTVVFEQGEEGKSWYLVVRGSVDVYIHGKGVVTTLYEGDDFGKLAIINEVPRAASIIVKEENCHLLRVDKEDFNRILRDVEANTVRLKEHGKDVLILEKRSKSNSSVKYMVMAGTPARIVEHLLESRVELAGSDPSLDDFLLTHVVYLPSRHLVLELRKHYNMDFFLHSNDLPMAYKKKVAIFIYKWVTIVRHPVFSDPSTVAFIEEVLGEAEGWEGLGGLAQRVGTELARSREAAAEAESKKKKWKLPPGGGPLTLFSASDNECTRIEPTDDVIFRVYCADHTYCTLRTSIGVSVESVKRAAAEKLGMRQRGEDLLLVELKSTGEKSSFRDSDISAPSSITLNSRIFLSHKDHLDALTIIPEQENPTEGLELDLEDINAREIAYHMSMFDWQLFWNIHEYELLYHTFGRHRYGHSTANLDIFLRRFNELQYWVVTELCLTQSLSKRVQILKKIIKIASHCKEYHNINGMIALVLGLSNVAISRLSLTWEKLPSKTKKLYTGLEATIDPSRNHRAYRATVANVSSPLIPFMPLLLKDMTFIHEGNKTSVDGLINFEKMHMLAQTLRTFRYCRSRHLVLDPPTPKNESEVKAYVKCLRTIDNQKTLTNLSQKLEPRRS